MILLIGAEQSRVQATRSESLSHSAALATCCCCSNRCLPLLINLIFESFAVFFLLLNNLLTTYIYLFDIKMRKLLDLALALETFFDSNSYFYFWQRLNNLLLQHVTWESYLESVEWREDQQMPYYNCISRSKSSRHMLLAVRRMSQVTSDPCRRRTEANFPFRLRRGRVKKTHTHRLTHIIKPQFSHFAVH